jgi:phosphoribosylglycinamide formyltransferase-1
MIQQKIAIFASGAGSNALNIIDYFKGNEQIEIAFILSNNEKAGIINFAREGGTKVIVCSNSDVESENFLKDLCLENGIDYIILAGFLRKIPQDLIIQFPEKIINIHPSLLPKFGGSGMYGKNVHIAVIEKKESTTGISIHFVNAEYDKGRIIAQFSCELSQNETLESVQAKIHGLEMENFPRVIEGVLNS